MAQEQLDANKSRQGCPIKTSFGGAGVWVPGKKDTASKTIMLDNAMDNMTSTSPTHIDNQQSEMKKSQSM